MALTKNYMGDSVYAEIDTETNTVTLTTDNGEGPTNTIILEMDTYDNLVGFIAKYAVEGEE